MAFKILLLLDFFLSLESCQRSQKWQQLVPEFLGDSEECFIEMYFLDNRLKSQQWTVQLFLEQNQIRRVYHWLQRQQMVTSVKVFGTG